MSVLANRYLDTEDTHERAVLRDILTTGIELDGQKREDQANRIINALARSLDNKGTHKHG